MEIVRLEFLTNDEIELLKQAEAAREKAYCPTSNFYVGAAVLSQDGKIFSGANIENKTSMGLTVCAERNALAIAYSQGAKIITKIGIITRGENFDVTEPTMPCGACRQWLYEATQLSGNDILVISSNTRRTKILASSARELLPYAFGPKDLGIDLSQYRK